MVEGWSHWGHTRFCGSAAEWDGTSGIFVFLFWFKKQKQKTTRKQMGKWISQDIYRSFCSDYSFLWHKKKGFNHAIFIHVWDIPLPLTFPCLSASSPLTPFSLTQPPLLSCHIKSYKIRISYSQLPCHTLWLPVSFKLSLWGEKSVLLFVVNYHVSWRLCLMCCHSLETSL